MKFSRGRLATGSPPAFFSWGGRISNAVIQVSVFLQTLYFGEHKSVTVLLSWRTIKSNKTQVGIGSTNLAKSENSF